MMLRDQFADEKTAKLKSIKRTPHDFMRAEQMEVVWLNMILNCLKRVISNAEFYKKQGVRSTVSDMW